MDTLWLQLIALLISCCNGCTLILTLRFLYYDNRTMITVLTVVVLTRCDSVLSNRLNPPNLNQDSLAMGDILPFKRPAPRKPGDIHKGKTLCKSGFHQWEISKDKQFDSRLGKLVTLYVCQRCGATKTKNL